MSCLRTRSPRTRLLAGLAALSTLGVSGCSQQVATEPAPQSTPPLVEVSQAPSPITSAPTPTTATTPLDSPSVDTSSIGPSQAAPSPTRTATATAPAATPSPATRRPTPTAVATRTVVLPDGFAGWTKLAGDVDGGWQTAGYSSDRGVIDVRARAGSLANPAQVAAGVVAGKVVPGTGCAEGARRKACASNTDGLLLVVSSATLETEELEPLLSQVAGAIR